jgi:hypothetical protein
MNMKAAVVKYAGSSEHPFGTEVLVDVWGILLGRTQRGIDQINEAVEDRR